MIEVIYAAPAMREVMRVVARVAPTNANVLITGESGTGKDVLAHAIHQLSTRAGEAFVKIDCAALPTTLLEAELFGYERGAFTGAVSAKPGRLESAHNGTLVLDEVAHLAIDAQAKLLRVIEERAFERLGGNRLVRVDTRIIALTNVELTNAVKRQVFREDLFYRLNVVHIVVPPLRERSEDVLLLAHKFLHTCAPKHGRPAREFSSEVSQLFIAYDFPGNVRELAHTIERAVLVCDNATIEVADIPTSIVAAVKQKRRQTKPPTLAEVEDDYIAETLRATAGNKSEAARILGISRKNLYEKLARRRKRETMKDERGTINVKE